MKQELRRARGSLPLCGVGIVLFDTWGMAGHLPDYSFIRYRYLPAWAKSSPPLGGAVRGQAVAPISQFQKEHAQRIASLVRRILWACFISPEARKSNQILNRKFIQYCVLERFGFCATIISS